MKSGAAPEPRQLDTTDPRDIAEQFRALFETPAVGAVQLAPDGTIVAANDRYCQMTGYDRDELLGMHLLDLSWPDDRDRDREVLQRSLAGDARVFRAERRYRRKDGSAVWVDVSAAIIRDPAGRAVRCVGVVLDASEHKRGEEELRRRERAAHESEARLRRLYDSGLVGVIYFDLDGAITDANDKFLEMVGYTRDDLHSGRLSWSDMTPPAYRAADEYALAELRTRGVDTPYEKEYVRKDGSRVPIIVGAATFGEESRHGVAFALDISDRKRAASERESLAAQRQLALDAARMGWWHYDPATQLASYDRRAGEIFGVPGSQRPQKDILSLLHPRDLSRVRKAIEAALDPAHPAPFSVECRIHRPDGAMRWVEAHGTAMFSGAAGERATSFVGTVADVTDRKRVEQQRERLLAELRATVGSVTDGLIVYKLDGSFAFMNPAAERIFGFSAEERQLPFGERILRARVTSETGAPLRPEETPPARALRGETLASQILRFQRADGEVWLSMGAAPIVTSAGERLGAVAVFSDITERKQTEDALEYSLERLWIAKDAAQLGIYDLDVPAGTGSVDDRVRELWGLAASERATFDRLVAGVHPDDRAAMQAAIDRALDPRGQGRYVAEHRVVARDGRERWVAVTGHVVFSDGRPHRVIGTVQEITERKRAEQASREAAARDAFRVRLSDALRLLADPVEIQAAATRLLGEELQASRVLYGEIVDGRVVVRADYTRDGTPSVVGSRRVEAFGPLYEQLGAGETLVLDDGRIASVAEVERATYEALGIRAHVSVPLVKNGRLAAFLSAHQSSPRAWTADEVSLMEEVAERTWSAIERTRAEEAMREANARLEEEDRRKNEFLAVLSHELRNPLAPIRNGLYVLERAAPGGDHARRAREIMERQVDQLTRLVDDLLDVTRIKRGKIQLQRRRLELNELVQRTIEDHRSLFEKAAVAIALRPAPERLFVDADWNRVAQVVGNLLQNAAKFTPRGGQVTVSLGTDVGGGQALIKVADTGVGMAPEVLARLFQPFMQADTTLDRSKGGLGLGLALVKGLVEQHAGSVDVKSPGLGHGAELTVRLPLGSPEPPEDVREPGELVRARRRVLVIEDNVESAESLRDVLELDGHEVVVAYDGADGIAKAHELAPDVVLCDIGLPGMDGYEVARALRADSALEGTKLVALSGYALPDDVSRATAAGFELHIAKPASREKLEEVLGLPPGADARN